MLLVNKICEHLSGRIENNELTNDDIVQNGVKHFRMIREIFNVKFVIENE